MSDIDSIDIDSSDAESSDIDSSEMESSDYDSDQYDSGSLGEYDDEDFAYLGYPDLSIPPRAYTPEGENDGGNGDDDDRSSLASEHDPDKYPVDLSKFPEVPALYDLTQSTRNFRDRLGDFPFELTEEEKAYKRAKRKQGGFPLYGPRSLGRMALAVLAKNADKLDARHVAGLSDEKRALLKKAVTQNADMSAKLWKLLLPRQAPLLPGYSALQPAPAVVSKAANGTTVTIEAGSAQSEKVLKNARKRAQMFCSQVRSPKHELGPYLETLTAPSMEFITNIRINSCGKSYFDYHELIKLAKMPNLGILEIMEINFPSLARMRGVTYDPPASGGSCNGRDPYRSSQVGDKLFIGWCSAKPVPFPELRVMRLWGCMSQTLTQRCLEYSAAFPKLAHLEVSVDRLHISDEKSRRPGPGFEDGPRGAWGQLSGYMTQYGWRGYKYDRSQFAYGDVSSRTPEKAKEKDAQLSINLVEPNSIARCAMEWGARIYSYVAQRGYRAKEDHDHLISVSKAMALTDHFPNFYNIASMTFGVDRRVRSYGSKDWKTLTLAFIRTTERIEAQAKANQRFKEEQAQRKADLAAERRARTKAQRDAAKAAKEAANPKPPVISARAKKRAAEDPLVSAPAKRASGTGEDRGIMTAEEVQTNLEQENRAAEEKRLARNAAARARRAALKAAQGNTGAESSQTAS